MSINALSGKVFLVVTGASKGIGRQIAISFASELESDSYILLMARDEVGLKETASRLPSNVAVDYKSVDLSTAKENEIQDILNASLEKKKEMKFSRLVVIHNAGSIGDVSQRTNDMTNLDVWRKYFDLNVFSPAILNGVLMKLFDVKTDKVVINITSLLALKPTKSVGYYCAGKAAREMFFKVFALENPQIDVLNYSPGPVETDMYQEICERATDTDVKEQFTTLRSNQSVLTTEQTVKQLLNVLKQHKYKSGDRVDYFDKL